MILLFLGFSLLFLSDTAFHPVCPMYAILGIPCPGCGMTRATHALLEGRVAESLYYNPLAIPVDLFIVVYAIWYTVDVVQGKDRINRYLKYTWTPKVYIPVMAVILANWAFNIYKYMIL